MARKRLNKNLVAFLTVMGILLSVAVVAIATYQNASKDPELYAGVGRDLEQRGESLLALERYLKAYGVNNEAKYLVDAARCAYQIGNIGGSGAIAMLKQAHTHEPRNVEVLEILLGHYWELRPKTNLRGTVIWLAMREHADWLLELDPQHVDALIYRSTALAGLVVDDSHNAELSDEDLQQAIDLAPNAPLVALARANTHLVEWSVLARAAAESGRSIIGDPAAEKLLTAALDIVNTALEIHPNEYELILSVVRLLGTLGRSDELADVLRDAIDRAPDDGKLHLELGRVLTGFIQKRRGDPARASEIEALDKEARTGLSRAIELDPALYDAHMLLAHLDWRDEDPSADPQEDYIRRGEACLKVFEDAIAAAVGYKSVTAALNPTGRMMLHLQGFEAALRYAAALTDKSLKSAVMDRAQAIYDQTKGQYAQWPVTNFMEGQFHRLKGKRLAAIQAFEMADRKTEGPWFRRLIREQLVLLYNQEKRYGLALKVLESVIELYEDQNEPVPLGHLIDKGGLLAVLDRPQEALHLVEDQLRRHPDEEKLLRIKAQALKSLGRIEEAQRTLASVPGQSDSVVLDAARMAVSTGDYARAEDTLRTLLAKNPENMTAVNLLVRVLITDGRRADAEQALVELRARVKGADLRRYLAAFGVALGTADEATRDAKMLELIQSNTDPFSRYAELYNFYIIERRRDLSKAQQYMDEMIKLRPDSPELIDKQFALALVTEDFAAAEALAAKLAALDADLCGGATYRGRLELARGNPEASVAELRSAARQRPSDSFLKTLVAQALMASSTGNTEEVIETLKAAVEIDPLSFAAHAMLFSAYDQVGNSEAAIEHLIIASKLNPSNPFIKANKELMDELDNPQQGIARRENLRETSPDDVKNLLRLGELYVRTGDAVRAEECLIAALDQDPTSLAVIQAAAHFYGDSGRREDAESVVRAYQAKVEGISKLYAYHLLASIAERMDDHAGAYEIYREARVFAGTLPTDGGLQRRAIVEVSFRTAEFCARRGLADDSIESYRAALAYLKPAATALRQQAMLRIIDGLLGKLSLGDAEREINAFRADYPEEPRGLIVLAELQIRRKQYRQAITTFSELLATVSDPTNRMHAYALYRRGSLHHDVGNYAPAKADLLEAKRGKPDAFGLKHRLALARVYETTGEHALAESELRELIPLFGDYRVPADRLINLLRRTGQLEQAQQIAREYMNKYPKRAFWPYALGSLLLDRGEASAAVEPLRRAVEVSLLHNRAVVHQAYWQLLTAMVRAGRHAEAIAAYQAIEADLIRPSTRARGAEAYYRNSQSERALELLEKAVHESVSDSWSELLSVLYVADTFLPDESVLSLFKRLSEQHKTDPNSAHYDAAYVKVLVLNEGATEAAELIESVVARTASGTPWRLAALELRGALAADDPMGQSRIYELMLEQDSDNVMATNNLALLLTEKLNRPKEGLKYAERANELVRRNPNILDTLGWVRFLNGRVEEAEQALLEAVMIQPANIAAHYHLGRIHAERGRSVKARQEYQTALLVARRTGNAKYQKLIDEAIKKLP